jgi:hypothetical protein
MPPRQDADAFIWLVVFLGQGYHFLSVFEVEGGAGLEDKVVEDWGGRFGGRGLKLGIGRSVLALA